MTVDRYALHRVAQPPAVPERGRHRRDRRDLRTPRGPGRHPPLSPGARTMAPRAGRGRCPAGRRGRGLRRPPGSMPAPGLQRGALFVHLASLVFGFGAVLAVDWVALLWVLRRRPLGDVLRTSRNTHLPAWLGYAGLLASGALLEPDLSSWATRVKLALVVLIGWNGLVATVMPEPLDRVAGTSAASGPTPPARVRSLTLLSQLGGGVPWRSASSAPR